MAHDGTQTPRAVCGARSVLPEVPRDPRQWRKVLLLLLRQHNWAHAAKPKGVSYKTMEERRKFLFSFFRELRADPVHPIRIDPRSLGRRHVQAAVERWIARGLSAGTMHAYLSHLRVFAKWIGKAGLVADIDAYARASAHANAHGAARVRRTYRATHDKSWDGRGVDLQEVLAQVDAIDPRVGAQLRMCHAFGLRVKEAIMIRPLQAVRVGSVVVPEGARDDAYLHVLRGTKGGRLRFVPIETEQQRQALLHACSVVSHPHESLAHPGLRLHQAYRRFYHVLHKCGVSGAVLGVTAHGLRHGYAHRVYEQMTGSAVPICGGGVSDLQADHAARLEASRRLGHARKSISGGVSRRAAAPRAAAPGSADAGLVHSHGGVMRRQARSGIAALMIFPLNLRCAA